MARLRNTSKHAERMITGQRISKSTVWRHANGRDTIGMKAEKAQKLTRREEECLAGAWLLFDEKGYRLQSKILEAVVRYVVQLRLPSEPVTIAKNWPQGFIQRHPCLKDRDLKLCSPRSRQDKARFMSEEMLVDEVRSQLEFYHQAEVPSENIWQVIVTAVLVDPCPLNIRDLVDVDIDLRETSHKKADMITVVECISKAGKALDPLILWPDDTYLEPEELRSGERWNHVRLRNGYFDTKSRNKWLQQIFDVATLQAVFPGSRVLLVDSPFDFLASKQFCEENQICVVSVGSTKGHSYWGPQTVTRNLQNAFNDAANAMHAREGRNLGRQDFVLLYHMAREKAIDHLNLDGLSESGDFQPLWEKEEQEQEKGPEDVQMHD